MEHEPQSNYVQIIKLNIIYFLLILYFSAFTDVTHTQFASNQLWLKYFVDGIISRSCIIIDEMHVGEIEIKSWNQLLRVIEQQKNHLRLSRFGSIHFRLCHNRLSPVIVQPCSSRTKVKYIWYAAVLQLYAFMTQNKKKFSVRFFVEYANLHGILNGVKGLVRIFMGALI